MVLRDLELDEQAVLRRAGQPSRLFEGDGSWVSVDDFYALFDAVEAEAGDPAVAVRGGTVLSAELFDPAYFAAICSPLSLHADSKSAEWINPQAVVGGHDVTDRAGALIGSDASSAGLLALNEDFRGFTRFVDEIDREMNPDGDDDLRKIIEAKCREYTLQKMLEAVLGVRQLENGNQWMANEIKDPLGPTALTTAFTADRYHTWQSVKRVVGSKARNIQAGAS